MPVLLRFSGIPDSLAKEARETLRSPQYGHPAHIELASGYGPCRCCLRTFRTGEEERLLFTYQPFRAPGALPAPGPIFIHRESCPRYDELGIPSDLVALPLAFEAYGDRGRLLRLKLLEGEEPEAAVETLFGDTGAEYVHVRNAEAGCFIARVDRCFACD